MIAKTKRPQAERAAEWVLVEVFDCVATRRALRTKYAKVDFFGCDVIGVKADGTRIWAQVTAGQIPAVASRRKRLEGFPWPRTDRVFVWQLVERQDPARPARKEWFFRVWEYRGRTRQWEALDDAIKIESAWFKARKEKK